MNMLNVQHHIYRQSIMIGNIDILAKERYKINAF